MKTTLPLLQAAIALAFSATAFADEPSIMIEHRHLADASVAQADAWKRWADDYSREMRTSMGTMFGGRMGGRTVKGAPYSAEVVTESNQSLPDGNVISRKTSGAIYRDGEGRMRQETGGDGKAPTVFIADPVAGKHFVLAPGSKKAVETSMPRALAMAKSGGNMTIHSDTVDGAHNVQVFSTNGTVVRVEDGKVFVDGKPVADGNTVVTTRSGKTIRVENGKVTIDGKPVSEIAAATAAAHAPHVRTIETTDENGNVRKEIRVQVINTGDGDFPTPPTPPTAPTAPHAPHAPLAPLPPMLGTLPMLPGVQTMRFESTARLGKGITTNLGMKDFDGVKAEGKSTVWTIPAGEIGNRNPINITSETWYSPDLQVTVSSRYNDPRTGETVYRLANLKRGEPAAALFEVPAEYAVKDKTRK